MSIRNVRIRSKSTFTPDRPPKAKLEVSTTASGKLTVTFGAKLDRVDSDIGQPHIAVTARPRGIMCAFVCARTMPFSSRKMLCSRTFEFLKRPSGNSARVHKSTGHYN